MADNNTNRSTQEANAVEFPRTARLLTGSAYAQVFKKSQRYTDTYWTVLVRRGTGQRARLGLAIAKKRAKRAIDRNKLKRIARESFRHHQQQLAHCEVVIMNRDAAASADKRELRQSIDQLLIKIARGSRHQR